MDEWTGYQMSNFIRKTYGEQFLNVGPKDSVGMLQLKTPSFNKRGLTFHLPPPLCPRQAQLGSWGQAGTIWHDLGGILGWEQG